MTDNERGLLWYGVIPTFFTTIVGLYMFGYQFFALKSSPFFGGDGNMDISGIRDTILEFASVHPWLTTLAVIAIILIILGNFLVPPLCSGGMIGLISAIHNKKAIAKGDGIKIGFNYFFNMLELELLLGAFSLIEIVLIFSLGARQLGTPIWFIVVMSVIFLTSFTLKFFFIYAPNFIVLENQGLTQSLISSAKMVLTNFKKTLLITLLMFLISIRVVINIFLVFLIPALIAFVINFFISKVTLIVGIVLGSLGGLIVFSLAIYLTGILHIFTTAAWTLTFLSMDHNRVENLLDR